jgi:hypothetical protein
MSTVFLGFSAKNKGRIVPIIDMLRIPSFFSFFLKNTQKKFFGFCTYQNQQAIYKTGFRDYNDPDKVGEMLTYSKRINF